MAYTVYQLNQGLKFREVSIPSSYCDWGVGLGTRNTTFVLTGNPAAVTEPSYPRTGLENLPAEKGWDVGVTADSGGEGSSEWRGQGIGGGLGRPEKPGRWRQPGRLRIEADPVQGRIEGSVEAWEW